MDRVEIGNVIAALKLRVDQQLEDVDNLATFVPIIDFPALTSANSHIIYGRNGTGKTHLLKAFHEYCEGDYEHTKILPVYIDCKTLELGTVGPEIEITFLVVRYYGLFVARVVEALNKFANTMLKPGLLEQMFGGDAVRRRNTIKASITDLQAIFRGEVIEERVKKFQLTRQSKRETKTGVSAGLTLKLDKLEPTFEARGGLTAEDTQQRGEAVELIYDGLSVIDYDEVRSKIELIIEQIGARSIIILIDEWSAIDLSLQPVLAEIIRKTLSASNRINLKIVALKYWTRLTAAVKPPQRIGLQPGIDIFAIADLDELLCYDIDSQAVKDFLTLVAYRHCAASSDTIAKLTPSGFERSMCSDLFDSPSAYLEIVRASEGNPRDFLGLLAACCSSRLNKGKILTQRDAVNAAVAHFVNSKEANLKTFDKAVVVLYKKLFERVVKNKQKLFLLTSDLVDRNDRLRELLHYRFIHLVNPSYPVLTDSGLPHTYTVFSMDYGNLARLKVTSAGEKVVQSAVSAAEILGKMIGGPWNLAGFITTALKGSGVEENLIKTAGLTVVGGGGVESGNIDPEILVPNCVYDDLL